MSKTVFKIWSGQITFDIQKAVLPLHIAHLAYIFANSISKSMPNGSVDMLRTKPCQTKKRTDGQSADLHLQVFRVASDSKITL